MQGKGNGGAYVTEKDTSQARWYLRRDGRQAGPLTSAEVRRLLLQGHVHLDHEVSLDRKTWRPLHAVAEVVPPQMRAGRDGSAAFGLEKRSAPVLAIGVSLVLVISAVGFGIWWGGAIPHASSDCQAPPVPGVDWRNCRLAGLQAAGVDLQGARLQNADLSGGVLAGTDLSQANMDYISLRQTDLAYAILRSASLRGADLRQADLTNADLREADLSFADLSQAKIAGVQLSGAILDHAIWVSGQTCSQGSRGDCIAVKNRQD